MAFSIDSLSKDEFKTVIKSLETLKNLEVPFGRMPITFEFPEKLTFEQYQEELNHRSRADALESVYHYFRMEADYRIDYVQGLYDAYEAQNQKGHSIGIAKIDDNLIAQKFRNHLQHVIEKTLKEKKAIKNLGLSNIDVYATFDFTDTTAFYSDNLTLEVLITLQTDS